MRRRIGAAVATVMAMLGAVVVAAPAPALAATATYETLLTEDSPYLATRVPEPSDTDRVVVAMEWYPTVDGTVVGGQICLDIPPRSPISAYLWSADGTMLAAGTETEAGLGSAPPCFHLHTFQSDQPRVEAYQHYVIGIYLPWGQYSYVPHGFDNDVSNLASGGHIVAPSRDHAYLGNGLYAYGTCCQWGDYLPANVWENSDYLVSPLFVPDPA